MSISNIELGSSQYRDLQAKTLFFKNSENQIAVQPQEEAKYTILDFKPTSQTTSINIPNYEGSNEQYLCVADTPINFNTGNSSLFLNQKGQFVSAGSGSSIYTLTTTDNSLQVLASVNVSNNTSYKFDINCIIRDVNDSEASNKNFFIIIDVDSSGGISSDSDIYALTEYISSNMIAIDLDYDIATNNIFKLVVNGLSSKTLKWRLSLNSISQGN